MHRLIKIYKTFGKDNQFKKLLEEFQELFDAFRQYKLGRYTNTETKADFIALMDELNDFRVLVSQIAIVEYGMNTAEIEAMLNSKVNRTIKIIDQIEPGKDKLQEYTRLRRNI